MNLDDCIIACFCLIDDLLAEILKGKRLRSRGPMPVLSDSEVLTMEIMGCYLGLCQDKQIFEYFQRHYAHFFPALGRLHRTTFVRQAANLWVIKERLWSHILNTCLSYDSELAIIDSMPIPVCQFARASRHRRFREEASYGKDHTSRQTFYGFRLHVRLAWPGIITRVLLAPANVHEREFVAGLVKGTQGLLLGDRNYWSPPLKEQLGGQGINLQTPYRNAKYEPAGSRSPVLGRVRYRIDTVFGQLAGRCGCKRVWAQDHWHLCSRLLRMILMHTIAVLFNLELEHQPLQLARLVS